MSNELKKASAGRKFYGSIVAFLIFGLVVLIWRHFSPSEASMDEKRAQARSAKLAALQKSDEQKLTTYAWVNKDKGIVQIPIDRAMQLVAVELAAKPITSSTVQVENPYPYGLQNLNFAPVPAASGTAAPAASGSAAPAASGTAAPATSGTSAPATSGSAAPAVAPIIGDMSGATPAQPSATPAPK